MKENPDDSQPFPEYLIEKPKEKWDCESIISTYSNLENHPTLIREEPKKKKKTIQLSKKTGIPIGVLPTKEKEEEEDDDLISENLGKKRNKNETKEEKRLRKKMIKMENRMKRQLKKETKKAFKKEEVKQQQLNALPHAKQRIVIKF